MLSGSLFPIQPRRSANSSPATRVRYLSITTTLRTNTRLVVVDVVATDSKGQPVTDLKPADFTLLEDGKPQKISGFNFEHPGAAPAAVVQAQLPASVVTNAPKFESNSLNVILFDTVNGEFAEHAYARDQLLKFLNARSWAGR